MNFLYKVFLETDTDGSGYVDLEEFQEAVTTDGATEMFATLGIQPHETIKIFKSMCDDDGNCNVDQFMKGLMDRKTQFDRECAELSGY